jgi:hypothetical protein
LAKAYLENGDEKQARAISEQIINRFQSKNLPKFVMNNIKEELVKTFPRLELSFLPWTT